MSNETGRKLTSKNSEQCRKSKSQVRIGRGAPRLLRGGKKSLPLKFVFFLTAIDSLPSSTRNHSISCGRELKVKWRLAIGNEKAPWPPNGDDRAMMINIVP